jgi:hypothetical protein
MADISHTRRGFLTQLSITTGVGIAGGLGLHRLLASDAPTAAPATGSRIQSPAASQPAAAQLPAGQAPTLDAVSLAGPMLVHIRDVANAEVAMMVGTRELIYRDPELVSRLVSTAQAANTKAEG